MSRRKAIVPEVGEVFAVGLTDGSQAVAQIAAVFTFPNGAFATCAFFPNREDSVEDVRRNLEQYDLEHPVAVFTLSSAVEPPWTSVGKRPCSYSNVDVQAGLREPWQWFKGEQHPWGYFLEAYHGLYPWNGFAKADYIDRLLLDGQQRPASAKMKAEFPPDFLKRFGL